LEKAGAREAPVGFLRLNRVARAPDHGEMNEDTSKSAMGPLLPTSALGACRPEPPCSSLRWGRGPSQQYSAVYPRSTGRAACDLGRRHLGVLAVRSTAAAGAASLGLQSALGIPLLFTEEFELVIMIKGVTEEMHGSD
jgi:hypothetical protein